MQGARRRCRWCCCKPGDKPHDAPCANEEIWDLREAICLIRSPPDLALSCSFDSFDAFNFFDLDSSKSWPSSPENSATYGSASLACALQVGEGILKNLAD